MKSGPAWWPGGRVQQNAAGAPAAMRMAALAAANLGIEVVIYAPDDQGPANMVVRESHVGAYDDEIALAKFADAVDAITYEFENVPVAAAKFVENIKPIFPQPIWLERAQHRLTEKDFIRSKGIDTAPYRPWKHTLAGHVSEKDLIVKTCAGGYDGKGQWRIKSGDKFPEIAGDLIIEDRIDLAGEVSVIICADQHGNTACYDPAWNVHKDGILDTSTIPAPSHVEEAKAMAMQLVKGEQFVGVLALELFITKDGKLLANEMAPRPHNFGHWTMDACVCSQFEQQIRAVAGLPLGSVTRHSDAVMTNLIGDDVKQVPELLARLDTAVHLYGKHDARPGRKMGHATVIKCLS